MANPDPIEIDEHTIMPSVNIDERAEADVIYFGKPFRPFGKDWVRIGLRDYVPMNILVDIISDMVPKTNLRTNWMSYKKEKLVDVMMKIYDKTDDAGRARIEKWVYAHRYRRKVQADYPFLRRLESFYLFLRDGKGGYKIYVPPDVATKVAAQITLSSIDDIREVKSILKTNICKKGEDWQVFDSLFNMWFNTTLTSYTGGRTTISPPPTSYLAFEGTDDDEANIAAVVKELKKVITTVGTGVGAGGGASKAASKAAEALKDLEQEMGDGGGDGEGGEGEEPTPESEEPKPKSDKDKEGKGEGKGDGDKGKEKKGKEKPSDEGKPPKEPTTEKEKEKERRIKTTKLLKDILKEHGGSLHINDLRKIAASKEV